MVYLALYFSLLLFSVISFNLTTEKQRIISFLFVLILILLAAVRKEVGTDYKTYESIWYGISPFKSSLRFHPEYGYLEPGFRYILSFLKLISDSPILFFSFFAFTTMTIFYIGIQRLQTNSIFVLFLFLCVFYIPYVFNGMRQALTMSLFVFSLYYMNKPEKKLLQVLFLGCIAGMIHITGFLIIPCYFIFKCRFNYTHFFIFGLIFSLVLYKSRFIVFIFEILFPFRIASYITYKYGDITLFQILTRTLVITTLFFFGRQIRERGFYHSVFKLYAIGFFLYISLFDYNMLATRLNMFFRILEPILFSSIISKSQNLFTKITVFSIALIPYTYQFIVNISSPDNFYRTVFH
jgi:hypothetical protein